MTGKKSLPLLFTALLAATPLAAQRNAGMRALVDQAESLLDVDDARAQALLERALPALGRAEDQALRMRAVALRCWAVAGTSDAARVVAVADSALAEAERAGDARARADLRACRGYGYDAAGRGDEAVAEYAFAVGEGRRLGDARVLAVALMLRGERRYYLGELGGALEDLNEAYALYTRLRVETRIGHTLTAIANVYADTRVAQYDRAIEYYRQLLASHQAAGRQPDIATAYFNLASTLERKNDLEAALGYYHRALELELRLGSREEAAVCQRALGAVLVRLGRPEEALRVLDQALAFFVRAGDAERVAQTRLSRGIALRALGRGPDALRDLDAAGERFRATGNARFLEKVEDERAQALRAAGDWRGAYEARTAQIELQRELADKLREEQSSRLRVAFDTEKKERENRALMRENALRGEALRSTLRIRGLQTAVLALSVAVMVVLVALVFRHLATARTMRSLALTDDLTRLPNRRHLLRLGDDRVAEARASGGTFGVLAFDVDHFKRINDTFGHEVGDRVLQRVAHACRGALRQDDVMGRTGGEEFVVLLPGADGLVAVEVGERLRTAVERVEWGDLSADLRVTVSVGATQFHASDDAFADAARRADASLYRAKTGGRNRTELAATPL